ncbi:MAG: 5-methyltetrahydropteroyltriglutamate--homocysteine methyltransferase [Solirubrobacteraceae bacterium]|nr:5-methyltetrahydropteroyltriglutamate--homocysteine methyltransferase [Solirubrobacteraceae bacterium]
MTTTASARATHRADIVGSLLRPDYLKEARARWLAGDLPTPEFKVIEDRAVDEAIALQERAGLDIVSDGEMRRYFYTGALTEAVEGISYVHARNDPWRGGDEESVSVDAAITGKLRRTRSLATEEFAYARARTDKVVKVTLPSPLVLAWFWSVEHTPAAYTDPLELFADGVEIIRQNVRELIDLGCQYVQIDAPETLIWAVDKEFQAHFREMTGIKVDKLIDQAADILNSVVEGLEGPTYALHLCRGNNQGRWAAEGGYEAVSKIVFERATAYDRFLLEYDSDRAGGFEPLAALPEDKMVVLGLVSTKEAALESRDVVIARIGEAAKYHRLDRLGISTQCGFASSEEGNPISPAAQQSKLQLVADVAREVWA